MLKHSWLSWWPCSIHDLFAGAAGRLGSLLHPQNPRINELVRSGGRTGTRQNLRAPLWCFHPDKPSAREEEEEVAWQNPSPQQ